MFAAPKAGRRAPALLALSNFVTYLGETAGSALPVCGPIPVTLLDSEGTGSVEALVSLPGAHL